MTVTCIGQVATARGHGQQRDLAGTPDPYTLPAANYRHLQDGPLPVLVDHDEGWAVGTVAALVRSRSTGLLAIMRVDGPVVDLFDDGLGDWYLSPGVTTRAGRLSLERDYARLFEVSLTRSPANIGTRPMRWSRSDIARDGGGHPAGLPLFWHSAWDRAAETMQRRAYRRADSLWIVDLDPLGPVDAPQAPTITTSPTPTPTPTPVVAEVRHTRAEVASDAAARGADGYDWTDDDGVRRHVRRGGTLAYVD